MYATMLEEEINNSKKFTAENFGLKIGDGFPEMVRDVAQSKAVSTKLITSLMLLALHGNDVIRCLPESPSDGDLGQVILKTMPAFETSLAMLYWGVQIGRRLERESMKVLTNLDDQKEAEL